MSHRRKDGLTKESSTQWHVENTKISACATFHLKCDNEGEPRKNTSFNFFV